MMKIISLPKKKQSIRVLNMITAIFILGSLFGCATGSTIITGTKRSAISPNEVKIYLDPPAEYESIGIIEVSSDVIFSRQTAQDKAMEALKSRAAKVGANGVLLTNTGSQSVGTAGYYSNGIFYGGGSSDKILAQGRAIYVIQE
ncbi:hypothetical protein [Proteiniphilum acetatigenes]|uniref:hypothetical protein n=1 Tax=Proteiniphilum acetatigenes TaxID=294710 RepID=UPI00036223E1|nr:hypothetical protein [Proteiniphilum acetatigenes]